MNLDTRNWATFKLNDIFILKGGFFNKKPEHSEEGNIPFLGSTEFNNGVTDYYSLVDISLWDKTGKPDNKLKGKIFEGNCIAVTVNGSVCNAYYQKRQFTCSHDITVLYTKNHNLNVNEALFICTIITKEKYRWSYGRKPHDIKKFGKSEIKLPVKNNEPDWKYMEEYIKSLNCKEITTKNKKGIKLDTSNWKEFKLKNICDITYGVNLELVNCEETSIDDDRAIPFVSRIEGNNGISTYVVRNEYEPNPGDTISVAAGGSVLSSFYQDREYYSGRDLYYLQTKDNTSKYAKLFLCALIEKNKYKYSYGRQANKTLKDLIIKLPVKNNKPDWKYMEDYIKKLPFGDRI